ncbi:alpha/beta hydrolase [Paenibacillus daejeonensis]|uniref:alpha/beta hydrolase n=1 Tax=Paenibacillus daejeonensis TaxID=135193 RepID=UPI00036F6E46|nr:alpha/beta hydrolase [Paenibacillus daejeonensis]
MHETVQLWDDVSYVKLQCYPVPETHGDPSVQKRPAIIVCPGGAFLGTSDREAEPVARRFNTKGMHAFVLRYTTYYQERITNLAEVPPGNPASAYPQPLLDLAKAILYVREHAEEFGVDSDRIVVCGFSAGGHLAASLGVHWSSELLRDTFGKESRWFQPNALILGYALLDYAAMTPKSNQAPDPGNARLAELANMAVFGKPDPTAEDYEHLSPARYVSPSTPPTFLWHTQADGLVYVENSLRFAGELAKHGVPFDLHIFEQGGHGLALSDETSARGPEHIDAHAAHWVDLAFSWLALRF